MYMQSAGSCGLTCVRMCFAEPKEGNKLTCCVACSIDGYAASEGDIYFFAAQLNPFNHKQVIALAPIVHK